MNISFHFLEIVEILLKLMIAALCAGAFARDRDKTSTSRITQILVLISLGTCLMVILWEYHFSQAIGLSLIFFASMIVVMGMISSAVILSHHGSSAGLSIAATIWVAGGIGMSVGYSMYFTAIVATIIGYLFIRLIDKRVEIGDERSQINKPNNVI